MKATKVAAALFAVAALAACDADSDRVTVVERSDYDQTMILAEMAWADSDADLREDVCWGFDNLSTSEFTAILAESIDGDEFDHSALIDFFAEQCDE
jgi:hypothetical protein